MNTILSGNGFEISETLFIVHFGTAIRSGCYNLYPNGYGWLSGKNMDHHTQCWQECDDEGIKHYYMLDK